MLWEKRLFKLRYQSRRRKQQSLMWREVLPHWLFLQKVHVLGTCLLTLFLQRFQSRGAGTSWAIFSILAALVTYWLLFRLNCLPKVRTCPSLLPPWAWQLFRCKEGEHQSIASGCPFEERSPGFSTMLVWSHQMKMDCQLCHLPFKAVLNIWEN